MDIPQHQKDLFNFSVEYTQDSISGTRTFAEANEQMKGLGSAQFYKFIDYLNVNSNLAETKMLNNVRDFMHSIVQVELGKIDVLYNTVFKFDLFKHNTIGILHGVCGHLAGRSGQHPLAEVALVPASEQGFLGKNFIDFYMKKALNELGIPKSKANTDYTPINIKDFLTRAKGQFDFYQDTNTPEKGVGNYNEGTNLPDLFISNKSEPMDASVDYRLVVASFAMGRMCRERQKLMTGRYINEVPLREIHTLPSEIVKLPDKDIAAALELSQGNIRYIRDYPRLLNKEVTNFREQLKDIVVRKKPSPLTSPNREPTQAVNPDKNRLI